ncbi:MAG: RpiB/LacA/LacB family sugar-phosphate isomerase [Dehalococcoidia bacterium]
MPRLTFPASPMRWAKRCGTVGPRTRHPPSSAAVSAPAWRRTKLRGVRAGLCHDTYSAHQGVEHDDMVSFAWARIIGIELATELCRSFLGARFLPSASGGGSTRCSPLKRASPTADSSRAVAGRRPCSRGGRRRMPG